jgi:hypothetical protein
LREEPDGPFLRNAELRRAARRRERQRHRHPEHRAEPRPTHPSRTVPRIAAAVLACLASSVILSVAPSARAEKGDPEPASFASAVDRRPNWIAGVVLERGLHSLTGDSVVDDQLFGLSATYFVAGRYGIHSRLLFSPNVDQLVDMRVFSALGFRLRTEVLGVETFIGTGAHVEARLRTHYWLAYVAPAELGATLWQKGSFRIQLFVGARAVVGGALIDTYLLDPNGVDNVKARDALSDEKQRPWEMYLSLCLARVM